MKKLLLQGLAILLFLFNNHLSFAQSGAELHSKGSGLIKFTFSGVKYSKVYDNDGENKLIAKAHSYTTNLYAEYGLSNKWNATLNAPIVIMNKVNGEVFSTNLGTIKVDEAQTSPGDLELGIKYLFLNYKEWKVALSFYQGMGTGKIDKKFGLNTGYDDFNQKFMFELQFKRSTKWRFRAMAAFNNHNNGFGDEALGNLETSFLLHRNLLVTMRLSGIHPFENGDKKDKPIESGKDISEGKFYGLFAQHSGIYLINPEVNYDITNLLGVVFSVNIPLKGQNIYTTPLYTAGIKINLAKSNNTENNDEK